MAGVALALAKMQAVSVVGSKEIVEAELEAKLKEMISCVMEAYEGRAVAYRHLILKGYARIATSETGWLR